MMKDVRITVKRIVTHDDLIEMYENPIKNACTMKSGQTFISKAGQIPEGFCDSAWESMEYFVKKLAAGGGN